MLIVHVDWILKIGAVLWWDPQQDASQWIEPASGSCQAIVSTLKAIIKSNFIANAVLSGDQFESNLIKEIPTRTSRKVEEWETLGRI